MEKIINHNEWFDFATEWFDFVYGLMADFIDYI